MNRVAALAITLALFATPLLAARADDTPLPNLPRPGERKSAPSGGTVTQHPGPTLSTAAKTAWPRLDAGAVVCRTRDDLRRHGQVIQARSTGTAFDGAPPNCRILGLPAAIDIVTRESPAATEVRLKDQPASTAWTDTWLPSQPPK
jgi:hypothetical protein